MSAMQQTRIPVYALNINTLPNWAMNGYFARANYLRHGEATIAEPLKTPQVSNKQSLTTPVSLTGP